MNFKTPTTTSTLLPQVHYLLGMTIRPDFVSIHLIRMGRVLNLI